MDAWLAGAVRRVENTVRYGTRMIASRVTGEPRLVLASLYPTHRCNLRCVYCNSPYMNTAELPTGAWLRIVDELAALGCRRVMILGGEPLLRSDVAALVDRARDRGMPCGIVSNGLLVPRRIAELRRLNLLVLSLDAPGPANDAVRGAGVFDAVRRAIAAARSAGVGVKINAVLSAKTAPHLDALVAFADREDLSLTLNVMRSGAPELWRNAASIKAADEEIARLLGRLAELARTNPRILFSPASYRYAATWGDYSRDRFEAHELPPEDPRRRDGPRCHAGRYYMSIGPDGGVFPCIATMGRLDGGNAASDGVEAAWRSLGRHPCVACYSPCLVEHNFLFSLKPSVVLHLVRRHFGRFA